MMFRITFLALVSLVCMSVMSVTSAAASPQDEPHPPAPFVADADLLPKQVILSRLPVLLANTTTPTRPSMLPLLYASFIGLEAYDGYSTLRGTKGGAVESNPLLHGFTDNPLAVWAVKGASTFASIYAAERLWKRHRRAEAVAVMVVANGVMAAVAARNGSIVRAQR